MLYIYIIWCFPSKWVLSTPTRGSSEAWRGRLEALVLPELHDDVRIQLVEDGVPRQLLRALQDHVDARALRHTALRLLDERHLGDPSEAESFKIPFKKL